MATVPVPHTWTAGDDATSTVLQTLTDAILFLLGLATSGGSKRALFRATLTVAQTLTTGTATALTLDSEATGVDYDNGHSTVTNTSRYTAQTAGWYRVAGSATFAANATGVRLVFLAVNGTERGGRVEVPNSSGAFITSVATQSELFFLNAGDFLEIFAQHTVGANLNVTAAALCAEWASN